MVGLWGRSRDCARGQKGGESSSFQIPFQIQVILEIESFPWGFYDFYLILLQILFWEVIRTLSSRGIYNNSNKKKKAENTALETGLRRWR
jgi:hypothetical protein